MGLIGSVGILQAGHERTQIPSRSGEGLRGPGAVPGLVRIPPRLRSPDALALLAANALPLIGVLLLDWSLPEVLLLYWAESAVVGGFTVLKMTLARSWAALFYVPFFCVHYGLFMLVHLVFLVAVFLRDVDPRATLAHVGLGALALVASHGVSLVRNHLRGGERDRVTVDKLFMAPYGRIVVMHLTVLFGAMLALALGSPVPALVLLVVLKTAADLRAHLKAREKGVAGAA